MKLRTIIFCILCALGILPIVSLVAINLAGHIERHERVERERSLAENQNDANTLATRLASSRHTLLRLASIPESLSLVTGRPLSLTDADDCQTIRRLARFHLQHEETVQGVRFVDANGQERLRLRRDRQQELASLPPARLRNLDHSRRFHQGLAQPLHQIQGNLSISPSRRQPIAATLELTTPLVLSQQRKGGLVILDIDLNNLLRPFRKAFWITPAGQVLRTADAHLPVHRSNDRRQRFARLLPRLASTQAFISRLGDDRKISWLPLSASAGETPLLWVGLPIDRSGAKEWKRSLVINILSIVLATVLVVALIASLIATKVDRMKESILNGLDRILTKEEDEVVFQWRGPTELVNLAHELTGLARQYALTRRARQQAEAALAESENKFRNLTASAQDAIALMDHQGRISSWNQAAAELFGYSEEEAVGKPLHTLISPHLSEESQESSALDQPATDGPIRETIELITRHRDGTEIPIELSLSEARIQEQWHSIWIIRDITERKRAEAEARLRQQQLIQADKMISLGLLVAGVAHEINNPNSIVMLNGSMLHRAWTSILPILDRRYQEQGDFLVAGINYSEMRTEIPRLFDELAGSGRRIKAIVQDLKEYARKDGRSRLEPVDLNQVATVAVRLTGNKLKKNSRCFSMNLAPGLPLISGHGQRLEQVLINLLHNSCEALTDPAQAITLTTTFDPQEEAVLVLVEDQGCGIHPEALHQLTDPFFTTKRHLGGTGLGLSVSAGIVKEHGGRIQFHSQPGKGTTVCLRFPALPTGDWEPPDPGKSSRGDDKPRYACYATRKSPPRCPDP